MNPAVGIDLGTTNTVVAIQTDSTGATLLDIRQPVHQRSVLESVDHIKSAVYFESAKSAVVGAFAAQRLDAFRSIKSRMGTRWRMNHPFSDDIVLTPAYISAHVLKAAFDGLVNAYPEWDRSALITVPASFNTDQRRDTLAAARMAGLDSVRLLDEPTAAFYYFFDQNRHSFSQHAGRHVLVFDFGGGTLDVSIIRVELGPDAIKLDAIGRSRYNNLGGDDIDLDLAACFAALWGNEGGVRLADLQNPTKSAVCQLFRRGASAYKEEVEEYIRLKMPLNELVIDEEVAAGEEATRVSLRRQLSEQQYEQVAGRFFDSKNSLNIFRPIGQALDVAAAIDRQFRKDDIDLVLYTGGASRMRGVQLALEAYFAPTRCFSISAEEACNTVALGAATCRYDEMHGNRGVQLTARLLEGILGRAETGTHYIPLVPLTCQPSKDFRDVDHDFRTQRAIVTLRVPLFRGGGVDDHNLTPMQDLEFKLPRVIEADAPYRLRYRMTDDKTIEMAASFPRDGVDLTAAIDIESAQAAGLRPKRQLCSVNKVR